MSTRTTQAQPKTTNTAVIAITVAALVGVLGILWASLVEMPAELTGTSDVLETLAADDEPSNSPPLSCRSEASRSLSRSR
jgi:hypothetical protein